MLRDVGELEILQAPGLPSIIPREYADLPHLTGERGLSARCQLELPHAAQLPHPPCTRTVWLLQRI